MFFFEPFFVIFRVAQLFSDFVLVSQMAPTKALELCLQLVVPVEGRNVVKESYIQLSEESSKEVCFNRSTKRAKHFGCKTTL